MGKRLERSKEKSLALEKKIEKRKQEIQNNILLSKERAEQVRQFHAHTTKNKSDKLRSRTVY